ncbi:MAG: precorrin-3B C(17)-methyltransferase [Oscillospiraceae bacterium]
MTRLYVVGIGPGSFENMTLRAQQALSESDVIVGYTLYVDLVREHYAEKEFLTTPMRGELARCKLAFSHAAAGQIVSLICSGDAGVYGMSGPILELSADYPDVEVEIIPGVSAVLSGAALLGAPLMHDFAVISLSDLMTPWEKIEKRLLCAAEADFVICLYNPSSNKRKDHLQRACSLILRFAAPETVCGIARNIGRAGESAEILTLAELQNAQVDMFATVFIGNSQTRAIDGKLVTPRGYDNE